MEDNLERTQVFLTKEQKKKLKRIAYETNSSQSELIRKAVSDYLCKNPCCEYMVIVNGRCMSCEKIRESEGK